MLLEGILMGLDVEKYYESELVSREIADFCRNRWVAVHCEAKKGDGRPLLVRYDRGKPLTISYPEDVKKILRRFSGLKPRTFYASASLYSRLASKEDALNYYENVYARTPTWDIDSRPEWWRATIKVVEAIVGALKDEGVSESVYVKWSGRGAHVHVHEDAISSELYGKFGPMNVAYCIVDYIIRKIKPTILKVNLDFKVEIKVENLMDPQRVFTAPLSLHKQLDVACIVFKPSQISEFDFEWTDPTRFKHNHEWRSYVEGEADKLARKAFKIIGPYPREVKREAPQTLIPAENIQKKLELLIPKKVEVPAIRKFKLEELRFNPNPPSLSGGRKFSKSSREAFLKVEDILSHYAQGNIDFEHAIKALNYAKNAIIPFQNYKPEDIAELIKLYDEAQKILFNLKSPKKVKEWLLSHGPPRRKHAKLDEFFKFKGEK